MTKSDPHDCCPCEAVAHGELGLIAPDESVARVVCNPRHISKKDGSIKPGVFPSSHIAKKGLSLIRLNHLSEDELKMHADAIASHDKKDTAVGVIKCDAKAIRNLVEADGTRSVCLFDDPIKDDPVVPDNPAHALLIAAKPMSEKQVAKVKEQLLYTLFSDLQRFPYKE